MNPEVARNAVEGYTNELEGESRTLDAFYRQFRCLRCKGPCRKEFVAGHAFAEGTLTARSCLRCTSCNCLLDPHSGLLLDLGDQKKALVNL